MVNGRGRRGICLPGGEDCVPVMGFSLGLVGNMSRWYLFVEPALARPRKPSWLVEEAGAGGVPGSQFKSSRDPG